ncbi:MAG: GNAT family N-acetyltransferase [Saprospiraceae bacterium]|nr:GNAT family N-acetyltransferase [Saprospiraceae bacterium]
MIRFVRTDFTHPDFQALVVLLDQELAIRDGADHAFYNQFNKIDKIQYVVLAYHHDVAVGCGAIKDFEPDVMEVKRMFVAPDGRQKGIASLVLAELENWARALGGAKCILETGVRQPEAIALYKKNGYVQIPNYGQYEGVSDSLCFEKFI